MSSAVLTNAEGREAAFCHNRQEAKNETETVKGKQPEASSKEQSGSQTGGGNSANFLKFITETDALGYQLPIYHISRKIRENGKDFPDCAHIIYVDSKNHEDTELGRLMHDFHCKAPEEMYNPVLRRQVYQFKKTREGVTFMCREMDKIYRDGEKIGQKRGIRNEQRRIVNSLKRKGKTMDEIAYLTGIHENVVRKLLGETASL